MHVGILRSANSQESPVDENIKKACRSIYGLMAAGLDGENGLDTETSVQLINTSLCSTNLCIWPRSFPS